MQKIVLIQSNQSGVVREEWKIEVGFDKIYGIDAARELLGMYEENRTR
jgi:hypothetical protein